LNNIVTNQSKENFGWLVAPMVNSNAAKRSLVAGFAP
jgi:hypothetical protein